MVFDSSIFEDLQTNNQSEKLFHIFAYWLNQAPGGNVRLGKIDDERKCTILLPKPSKSLGLQQSFSLGAERRCLWTAASDTRHSSAAFPRGSDWLEHEWLRVLGWSTELSVADRRHDEPMINPPGAHSPEIDTKFGRRPGRTSEFDCIPCALIRLPMAKTARLPFGRST